MTVAWRKASNTVSEFMDQPLFKYTISDSQQTVVQQYDRVRKMFVIRFESCRCSVT